MRKTRTEAHWILVGLALCACGLLLSEKSHAWQGEPWAAITRSAIEARATGMIKNQWRPKSTIRNFGYDNTYHSFDQGTTYTGIAYSQNNPQENWSEFRNLVKNTSGGNTGYGTDCSGFASIVWKLPRRYTTSMFESDATQSGGYVKSLGAVGSGQKVDLMLGDGLNKKGGHILLFKKRTAGGIISMEQTPWTARSREWSWVQLSQYRPVRRSNISAESSSSAEVTGAVATSGGSLNVRSGPGSEYAVVDTLANGAPVAIQCRVTGQTIRGKLGTTDQWYRIGIKKFASAAYISASAAPPVCD